MCAGQSVIALYNNYISNGKITFAQKRKHVKQIASIWYALCILNDLVNVMFEPKQLTVSNM